MEKTINHRLQRGELTAIIRAMEVGDVLRFPIEKHNSVRSTVSNGLLVERADGMRWTVNADLQRRQSIITRTQ